MESRSTLTHRPNEGTVLVVDHLPDFPDRGLQREQLVQQTEGRGRPPCIAAHPRLHMVHALVDLVNDLQASPGAALRRWRSWNDLGPLGQSGPKRTSADDENFSQVLL